MVNGSECIREKLNTRDIYTTGAVKSICQINAPTLSLTRTVHYPAEYCRIDAPRPVFPQNLCFC